MPLFVSHIYSIFRHIKKFDAPIDNTEDTTDICMSYEPLVSISCSLIE